jgi:hypothetical protein
LVQRGIIKKEDADRLTVKEIANLMAKQKRERPRDPAFASNVARNSPIRHYHDGFGDQTTNTI